MSGRFVTITRLKHRVAATVAFAALGALACGFAQPTPEPKAPVEDPNKVDNRDPLPADTPRHKARERLRINRDREIFTKIEDFKPVASQDKNRAEYDAWIEFVLHAKKQHARDLDEYAIRDLVPLDLTQTMLAAYRTELIRFDGKLVCVRRLVAPPLLKLTGIAELYEARLVPLDDSPLTPVSIVFLDLPESLAAVRDKPPEEWLDAGGWVTASGYFFKAMTVPGERANAVVSVPLLIGKGLTPLAGPPVLPDDPTALDKSVRVYKFIKEDTPMIRTTPTEVTWPEVAADNRVILHASRFSAEELEKYAAKDLKFADLFGNGRLAHKLSCVRFEGRLISLRRVKVADNDWLAAAGVTNLFEGWMIPADERSGNPICIMFTEPLAGVEPNGRVNQWVSFAGYSFKRMRYTSQEQDAKTPTKNVDKLAPLLIGRGPIARPDPDGHTPVSWGVFMQVVVIGGVLLVVSAAALTWWYRGGDRKAKEQMAAVRNRNPFDPNETPPAA